MASLLPELADLFPDSVTIDTGTTDGYGAFSLVSTRTVPARVVGRVRMVRDQTGQERVSTVQAWLTITGASVADRFTLPARFVPRQPPAIAIGHSTDEDGAHHEVVYF